jgi:hypothetical protein
MRKILGTSVAFAALAVFALGVAQPPRTTEERLAALEQGLATLDTRFGLESTREPNLGGASGAALEARVTMLERELDRLATDVQRIERIADTAARDAASAQRDAMTAQQMARDAALRR